MRTSKMLTISITSRTLTTLSEVSTLRTLSISRTIRMLKTINDIKNAKSTKSLKNSLSVTHPVAERHMRKMHKETFVEEVLMRILMTKIYLPNTYLADLTSEI